MIQAIHKKFSDKKEALEAIIKNFDAKTLNYDKLDRNTIKLFDLEGTILNVKSFKVPNIINKFVYRFFRKSKAQRSYEYALKLLDLGIGTPQPIAFYEFPKLLAFDKSYYISAHLDCDYTFRDLTKNFDLPDYENILRAFTRFTYKLHENNVLFLDHSPGNTLIKIVDNGYEFFLVDLNRMQFKPLNYYERIQNFARLTTHKSMIKIMSDEYAKCMDKKANDVYDLMWELTDKFQEKFHRKKRLKKKLKF
jgi:hypothetical protein